MRRADLVVDEQCPNCASEDWADVTGFESEDLQRLCNECGYMWEVERDL